MSRKALSERLAKRKQALESNNGVDAIAVAPLPHLIENSNGLSRQLILATGKQITLSLHCLTGRDQIERLSIIDDSNIREQAWLNTEALSDILSSIEQIQLYPAVGYYNQSNTISIVDGSRRRQAAIIKNCQYWIEVSDLPLSKKEAEEIVSLSEKKKKFTDYEWGKFYSAKLAKNQISQKELAERDSLNPATLSRYINAYKVDNVIYELFLDKSVIATVADSQRLIKIFKTICKLALDISQVANDANTLIYADVEQCQTPEDHKELVFVSLESVVKKYQLGKAGRKKKATETLNLYMGNNKQEFIRYQADNEHKSTIVLSRISADKRERIRLAILQVMNQ